MQTATRRLLHLSLLFSALMMGSVVWGQTEIHCWDFNVGAAGSTPKWPSPINTLARVTGSGTITHNIENTNDFGGHTNNACIGSIAGSAFCPVSNSNNGKSFQMNFSTEGYEGIIFSFWTVRSESGFNNNSLDYSVNAGVDWINIANFNPTTNSSGQVLTYDLSAISSVDNNPDFRLRITIDGATAGTGNNRYDNIKLTAEAPLPVELVRFEAREELLGAALSWETATELNNELFEVQHSRDSRHWGVIGVVEGAGTTLLSQTYTYLHERPGRGMHYYRLRQVDYDGAYAYSPVRAVDIRDGDAAPDDWSVRPTVASDLIHLIRHHGSSEARWTVLSADGRPILYGLLGPEQDLQPIEIDRLMPGIYFLQVLSREGVWTTRFQKM